MQLDIYDPILSRGDPGSRLDLESIEWRQGILLRSTNWLGDALMTLPAVERIAGAMPDSCAMTVLCPQGLAPLWEAAPWVASTIAMKGKRVTRLDSRRIRGLRAGVAVVLPNSFGAAWDVFMKGIPLRVGRGGRGRNWMLTHRLPEWKRPTGAASCHQLSHYLELADAFGDIEWTAECPGLEVPDAARTAAALGLAADRQPWLVVAPGAAYGPAKQWPADRFAEVSSWWDRTGGSVAVVGTAAEQPAAAVIEERVPNVVNLAGSTTLDQLMAVLSIADIVLANDSGVMHLGAALGCRGVAVFGSTDPVATGPIGGRWVVLHRPPTCSPCFQRTCPRTDSLYECLQRIGVDMVQDAIRTVNETT